jgi:hypothetical protein
METAVKDENGGALVVEVSVRWNYGRAAVYPANDLARTLADLAGHRTLTQQDLGLIRKLPGVSVTVADDPHGIPEWVRGPADGYSREESHA